MNRDESFSFQPCYKTAWKRTSCPADVFVAKKFRNMPTEKNVNMLNTYLLNDSMMLRSLVRASSSTGNDVSRLFLGRNPITFVTLVQLVLIESSCGSIIILIWVHSEQHDHSIYLRSTCTSCCSLENSRGISESLLNPRLISARVSLSSTILQNEETVIRQTCTAVVSVAFSNNLIIIE